MNKFLQTTLKTGKTRWIVMLSISCLSIFFLIGADYYWKRFGTRPICLPQLPFPGNDPPKVMKPFKAPSDLPIPTQNDWIDFGPVLEAGAEGEWDFFWAGLTPASVIKKDGTFYFYYVAADGYRSFDGDARHRSIGVATSPDGIRFTKHDGNPIMTHRPYDGEEEGANSAGMYLDEKGQFVMVYGAAKGPHDLIVADARYAFSDDGLKFTDAGRALYHCNIRLYGWGDEIFPIAVHQIGNRWFVYYQPNGIPGTARTLGAAWGKSLDRLTNSKKVLGTESGGLPVDTWGNIIQLDDDTLVFFNQRLWWPDTFVEVRIASPETPYHLSEPVARYDIPNLKRGVIYLDKERRTWFMYYNDFSRYWHVKLAPFGAPDKTPPTSPSKLSSKGLAHDSVQLFWKPASDEDTGVVEYRIYRDGKLVGKTKDLEWIDFEVEGDRNYYYGVSAVNYHGTEGKPASVKVTTPIDLTPPKITSITVSGKLSQVLINFNKPIDRSTATDISNYTVNDGIYIIQARLMDDNQSVVLITSPHVSGKVYELIVTGIVAASKRSAQLTAVTRFYTASSIPGLVGRWLHQKGEYDVGKDVSGFGLDGSNHGVIKKGKGEDFYFNGVDSYVQVSGEGHLKHLTDSQFSISLHVRPESIPSSVHGAPVFFRVGGHPAYYHGISLTRDGRLQAQIFNRDETYFRLASQPVEIENWYHVVMVVDGPAKQMYLYLDNKPAPDSPLMLKGKLTQLWHDSPRDDRSGAYFIGSNMPDRGAGSFFTAHFHGSIANVRLYDRALESNEVNQIWEEYQK
jgi:hypothetical protein